MTRIARKPMARTLAGLLVVLSMMLACAGASASSVVWSQDEWGTVDAALSPGCTFAHGTGAAKQAMAVAANGDVVVAGCALDHQPAPLVAARFSAATGQPVWIATYHGLFPGYDRAGGIAVAIDAAGDVVVGGYSSDEAYVMTGRVNKYDGSTGALLWSAALSDLMRVEALALGPGGSVYVTGTTRSELDVRAAKIDGATGAVAWQSGGSLAERGEGTAIAVDGSGHAFVTGNLSGKMRVLRLDGATGAVAWQLLNASAIGNDVKLDAAGDLLIAGGILRTYPADFCVLKLERNAGGTVWTACLDGGGSAAALALGPSGEIYATGSTIVGPYLQMRTVRIDPTGTVAWSVAPTGLLGDGVAISGAATSLLGEGVAISGAETGSPVVTGWTTPDFQNALRVSRTVRYNGTSGAVQWTVDGPQGVYSSGASVAVDTAGNVFTGLRNGVRKHSAADGAEAWLASPITLRGGTGFSRGSGPAGPRAGRIATRATMSPSGSVLTVRDTTTGAAIWSREVDPETYGRHHLGADGSVVTSASLAIDPKTRGGLSDRVVTTKYAAADGAILWQAQYGPRPSAYMNVGMSVVDGTGAVTIAGSTCPYDPPFSGLCPSEGWIERYGGSTGHRLWHATHGTVIDGVSDFIGAIVVDAAGDVIASGSRTRAKYSAATGAVLWSVPQDSPPVYGGVVDAQGNVTGWRRTNDDRVSVSKFSGSTGAELWTTSSVAGSYVGPIQLAPNGDVIAAAGDYDGSVRRVSADGRVLWVRLVKGATTGIAVDAQGDVLLSQSLFDWQSQRYRESRVVKLRGDTGRIVALDSIGAADTVPMGIALDATGVYVTLSITAGREPSRARTLKMVVTEALQPVPAAMDFDGDGKSDLLWAHTDGRVAVWLMDSLSPAVQAEVPPPSGSASFALVGAWDAHGDGKTDLVWQQSNGALWLSPMNGAAPYYAPWQVTGNAEGWQLAAAGDLDGDGRKDFVLQHPDGRVLAMIYPVGPQATILGAGTGWIVQRVADFDGDGRDDILFRHPDGRHAIWLMDGTTPKAQVQILNAGGWTATHTLDLDGDGRADILWQHTDGTVAAWIMNGTAMKSGATILDAGSGWSVTQTGDFDGDGKDDLFFTHADGRAAIYLMNGLVPAQTTQILNAGSGWSARRLLDLNGDGKLDIVWEHTDGRVAAWLMNGTAMTDGREVIGAGTGWRVSDVGR
ncbi:hypothetical protein BWI17_14695 [Betaproteobacteria bacterium GR16-43]|nr:hypothetical protein BWI17_14695 [Betaproteobacteria bacterium GR16-43]